MTRRPNACLLILWICLICYSKSAFSQTNAPVIDFASDTQAPLFVEKIFLRSNHNEDATRLIFKDITTLHPSGLFILGDVVSLGYQDTKWKQVDTSIKVLRKEGVPVYATLGNHELMINAAKGEKRFRSRFPAYEPSGYVETIDSVAIILLNSNFKKMTAAAIKNQDAWYKNALHQLDSDASVKFVVVGCHHSPFTNSRVVAPSLTVQQKFVGPFLKEKKCVLFLSGHSHNFEQFKVSGKQFLVIGGGGGIHQPLNTDTTKMPDISANYKPMFHYLELRRVRDSIQVTSRQLKPDFSGFNDGLTFTVTQ